MLNTTPTDRLHSAIKENETKSHRLVNSIVDHGASFRESPDFQKNAMDISQFENMFAAKVTALKHQHSERKRDLKEIGEHHVKTESQLAETVDRSNDMLSEETSQHKKLIDLSARAEELRRDGVMHRDRAMAYLFIVLGVISICALAGRGGKALIAAYVVLVLCGLAVAYYGIRALLGWLTS